MKNLSYISVIACLAMLLAACSSAIGDAAAGPNPGGGFYDGPNINVGHVNPLQSPYYGRAYTVVGQARR